MVDDTTVRLAPAQPSNEPPQPGPSHNGHPLKPRVRFRWPTGRRLLILAAAAAATIVAVVLVLQFVFPRGTGLVTASGTIEAIEVDLSSKVPGRLADLLVADGQRVAQGQLLARLDPVDQRLAYEQADANYIAAQAKLAAAQSAYVLEQLQYPAAVAQAKAGVAEAHARVPQAGETLNLQAATVADQLAQAGAAQAGAESAATAARANASAAQANAVAARADQHRAASDYARAKSLYAQGYVSAQALDAALAAADTSQAKVNAAVAQAEAARRQVAAADDAVAQARAALALAQANSRSVTVQQYNVAAAAAQELASKAALTSVTAQKQLIEQRRRDVDVARASLGVAAVALDVARNQLAETMIKAPFDGVVFSHSAEAGDLLAAGAPIVTLIKQDSLYLRVYVLEPDLARIAVGQHVGIVVDGMPKRTFSGVVAAIDDKAQFTPSNVQTKDQRAELVYGVKIDLHDPSGTLKPGMPADATIGS